MVDMYYSLNSLKGGYIGDDIGDYIEFRVQGLQSELFKGRLYRVWDFGFGV